MFRKFARQHVLKNTENQENMILQFLLDLSSQCGVSFTSPNGSAFHCASQTSLHAIEDDSSIDIQAAWDDVRLNLRRYLVGKLQDNTDAYSNELKIKLKTQCLQHLLFLYPESDVLMKYQNIQRNIVVDRLHNYSERDTYLVLKTYQEAIPEVFSMIKQDLFVLNSVTDSPLIIHFINEAFFETITEEMKTFFEILYENKPEENSSQAGKSNMSKLKARVQAFDTANKGHSRKAVYLHLDQLNLLSKFIKSLLWLEAKVEEATSEILFPSSSTDMKGNIQGILKTDCAEVKANESYVLDERSLLMKEMPTLKFGWRNTLKALSHYLLHCLPIEVEVFSTQILQSENEEDTSPGGCRISFASIPRSYEYYGAVSEKEKPKRVAKFCYKLTEEFNALFPLALACRDGSLQEIRACFVEAVSQTAGLVLTKLEEWSNQVPASAPLQNTIVVFSTALHVLHHLTYYNDHMSKKPLFPASVQRYQEFIRNLQFQVTNYCINICATSIFQDAESHHWDDNKAFYEGERCSFSIQMWHYFCMGLRHDLWTVLPPKLAQEILREVLAETLALLVYRYSQASPNYKRASQIRIDIMAILSCVENLLWSVCSSVQELMKPTEHSKDFISKIHNHCSSLLIVLCVLTAPLQSLHETFKTGFSGLPSDPSESACVDKLYWLSFIKPSLFRPLAKTPSAGEMAVQGQLKLLLSQPCCNWNLLLEMLLHPDCLIARTLLSCSMTEVVESDDVMSLDQYPSLTQVILTVLSYCSLSPKTFTDVLEKYMDEGRLWDALCIQSEYNGKKPVPQVIKYLRRILMKYVSGIIKQIVSVIHNIELTEQSGSRVLEYNIPENLLKALPEKWNFIPREVKDKSSQKSFARLAGEAVSTVISQLPSVIACLPSPIKYFYSVSERKISEQYTELKETGILVCNVIYVICQILEDERNLESIMSSTLSRWGKDLLVTVGTCLETTIGIKNGDSKEVAQRVLENIEKQRPTWIGNQMQKARTLSLQCDFTKLGDGSVLKDQGSGLELTEQKINMMVLDICHKPGGSEYLRQIYHIIQLNEEYLYEALSCQTSNKISSNHRTFQLNLTSLEDQLVSFNPLQLFTIPSSYAQNEANTSESSWDWAQLLSNCLGINALTFKALLGHRWESKDKESLSEEEQRLMEDLKQL
ncbi:uncharacterized protein KIAA0825 homolog [Discoglossus pictus]